MQNKNPYLHFTWAYYQTSNITVLKTALNTTSVEPSTEGHSNSTAVLNHDDWLTVHRSITLVDFQLDAQNSYLFPYNAFIKILCMFRALPCSSSGGLRRKCIYAASGIVTLCR